MFTTTSHTNNWAAWERVRMVNCAIAGRLSELSKSELQRLPFGGAVFADLDAVERGDVNRRDIAIVNDCYDELAIAKVHAGREMMEVASFASVTSDLAVDGNVDERPAAESSYLPAFMALKRSALLSLLIGYAASMTEDALADCTA